jgi:hypothetical protein
MARKAHVSINNRWLPYWEDDKVESDLSMSNILDGIRGVLEKEEEIEAETDGGPQWNNRGLVPHLKRLHTYIKLRYPLKSEDVATFLDLATRLVLSDKLPVRAQVSPSVGVSTLWGSGWIDFTQIKAITCHNPCPSRNASLEEKNVPTWLRALVIPWHLGAVSAH